MEYVEKVDEEAMKAARAERARKAAKAKRDAAYNEELQVKTTKKCTWTPLSNMSTLSETVPETQGANFEKRAAEVR